MGTVTELINRLEKLKPQLETETARIIQRSPDLLKAKALEFKKGETPDGGRIGYYRWKEYRSLKLSMNPLAKGTVDLFFHGDFVRGLFVEKIRDKLFQFDSHDEKADKLFSEPTRFSKAAYGSGIRGLNEETWLEIQRMYIAPELVKWIKREAKL